MAEDDGGGNPFGGGLFGRGGRGRGGGRGGGGGKSWLSAGLEFDVKGVEAFTKAIEKAETAVGKFVGHFKDLSDLLDKMPKDKLDAMAAMGGGGGGSGRNGGDFRIPGNVGTVGPSSPYQSKLHEASTERPAGDTGEDEGSRRRRFGGGQGMIPGGIETAYFAGQIAQSVTGRIQGYAANARTQWSTIDYANVGAGMASARFGRSQYANSDMWNNMVGATGVQDVGQMVGAAPYLMPGASMGRQSTFMNQMALSNVTNPAYGSASQAMQAYQSSTLSNQALWRQQMFGVPMAAQGGQARNPNAVKSDMILWATGQEGFGKGGLTKKQAETTFGQFGIGRQNLRIMGYSEAEIDEMAMLGQGAAKYGSVSAFQKSDDYKETIRYDEARAQQESTRRTANEAEKGRGALRGTIRLEGKATQMIGDVTDEFSYLIPVLGTFGTALNNVTEALVGIEGVNDFRQGQQSGGVGGGGSGLIGRGLEYLGMRQVAKTVLGRTGGTAALRAGVGAAATGVVGTVAGTAAAGYAWTRAAADQSSGIGGWWQRNVADHMPNPLGIGEGDVMEGDEGFGPGGDSTHGSASRRPFTMDLPGPGREAGFDTAFHTNLARMFAESPYDFTLTSGFRTAAEQRDLIRRKGLISEGGLAAPVGKSKHQKGLAADLGERGDSLSNSAARWLRENAPKYGLKVPMPGKEPWHVVLSGKGSGSFSGGEQEVAPGGGGGGGIASHRFFGASSTLTSIFNSLSKAPGYEHAFSGGGGGGGKGGAMNGRAYTGGAISQQEAFDLAVGAGFTRDQARIMSAIAVPESSLNPGAHNPDASTGDNSYGLWQINMLGQMGNDRRRAFSISSNEELFDPKTNAKAAKMIFDWQGFDAWTTYKKGAHQPYMDPGIGDVMEMGGSRPSVVSSGGGGVHIGNVNLDIRVDKVSDEEARRLARMTIDHIKEEAKMAKLGGI